MTDNGVINQDENIANSRDIEEYLEKLSKREKEIIEIAIEVLGSSFDIKKSIGFEEWKKISK